MSAGSTIPWVDGSSFGQHSCRLTDQELGSTQSHSPDPGPVNKSIILLAYFEMMFVLNKD